MSLQELNSSSSKLSVPALLAALKSCSQSRDLERGKVLHHAAIEAFGGDLDAYVASNLITMYAKCGSLEEARKIFDAVKVRDAVVWTSVIAGYAENGESFQALEMLWRMQQQQGCAQDALLFVAALKACTGLADKEEPKLVCGKPVKVGARQRAMKMHCQAAKLGFDLDIRVASTLVDMYAKCGSMENARRVFDGTKQPNVVCWNALLFGYAKNGEGAATLKLFRRMQLEGCAPNALTFVAALRACSLLDAWKLNNGRAIHALAALSGCVADGRVKSALVDMYARCGSISSAYEVFDRMERRDAIAWNALIFAYVENGEGDSALALFARMEAAASFEPNVATFVAVLKACSSMAAKEKGRLQAGRRLVKLSSQHKGMIVHSHIACSRCSSDPRIASSLIDMYAKCGAVEDAGLVFSRMEHRDLVAWNSFMFGCAESGEIHLALDLFHTMQLEGCAPDALSLVAALKSCESLDKLIEVHSHAVTRDLDLDSFITSSLVDMYVKLGSLVDAQKVFDMALHRDAPCWTAMILGYVEHGEGERALELFSRMKRQGCEPDARTYVAALKACSMLGALDIGKTIHVDVHARRLEEDAFLMTALVDLYCKCGNMVEAHRVFDSHSSKDTVTWNALIAGYSHLGDTDHVLRLFDRMQDARLHPNSVTFLSVLTACSHAGLVDRGKEYFEAMSSKYGLVPCIEHYHCVVDMLSRANRLDDAIAVVKSMPYTPTAVSWMTVLSACREYNPQQDFPA